MPKRRKTNLSRKCKKSRNHHEKRKDESIEESEARKTYTNNLQTISRSLETDEERSQRNANNQLSCSIKRLLN